MFSFGRENTGLVAKWWRNVDKQILFMFVFLLFLGLFMKQLRDMTKGGPLSL